MFGLELHRRSAEAGWGITSNAAHPGITATNLLAAQPQLGRPKDTLGVRLIRFLAGRGVLTQTVDQGLLPALLAATGYAAEGGKFYVPGGFMNLSGPPAEQAVYRPARDTVDAARLWETSEQLTGVRFALT